MNKVTFNVERCKGADSASAYVPKYLSWARFKLEGLSPCSITDQEKCIACAMSR